MGGNDTIIQGDAMRRHDATQHQPTDGRGFCLGMSKGMSRLGNTSVRKPLSDDRFTDAVLQFGIVKEHGAWKD